MPDTGEDTNGDGSDDRDVPTAVARAARGAGRRFGETEQAYHEGRIAGRYGLPVDEAGRARIVCRRAAERRAVRIEDGGHPTCFEADHPACEGCVEDIRRGQVETWPR